MIDKLIKIIEAIDDCEGILIPYPICKQMAALSKELKGIVTISDTSGSAKSTPEKPGQGGE
jgi:hypothetical protein